ncbi:AbrB/MazE/SpoVT family DNA-binding domain-containing protein [Thermococcus stetteri]|uniref:AbrB/MazE/SpoVT family DNA-binding domain-containing protein n=1 Tax=Thermococcus stetteri TaxID=49900 RepID=UPI001AE65C77|nr:AbrB/MazE/SpoVT family DNA-binding domain-containing protein [Thermococcus stetteri]MBP1912207.1 AbrB family looped-hinge helix DNA binding protein [Thermococcus stetteri]
MVTVKVSSKGQIVLPKSIREKLGINPGDEVEVLDFGNEIVIVPIKKDVRLRGLVKFGKSVREILKETRAEEEELEARK